MSDVVEFYDRWSTDADFPADRLFGDDIEDLEPTGAEYDPDDAAPWSWNLDADLFAEDMEWSGLLELLQTGSVKSDLNYLKIILKKWLAAITG